MARLGVFSKDIRLFANENLSVEARQKLVANAARGILARAQEDNVKALGRNVDHETFVDGRKGAPLESVNVERGKIVFEFDLFEPALAWIGEQLVLASPVLTGSYQRSHILLADGVEVDPDGDIPAAETYTFVNPLPYARKIERGLSDQTPDGVYEEVAKAASGRFGNIVRIRFTYRSLLVPMERSRAARAAERDSRSPAIVVTPR